MRAHELVARALEVLGEAQQRRAAVQALGVALAEQRRHRPRHGHALAVVARGLRDDRRLDRREPRQAAVEDQVAGVLVVVVVVDRHADVVQHARRPQQLALARVAVVQAEPGELVEHASASAATWRVWSTSTWYWAAMFSTLARRTSSNSGGSASGAPPAEPGQALEEHPLAQPRLGRLQRVEAARPQHALHDHRAGQDQVGARAA